MDLLKYQVELVILLEELYKLDDVLVSLAMMKHLDLLEHPRSAVRWNLFYDLWDTKNYSATLHSHCDIIKPYLNYNTVLISNLCDEQMINLPLLHTLNLYRC